ncbi:glycosyl hydrolase family 18 protein [Actinokineospora sp. NBRC 105648]|uniref:chitinase C-terminal domain-containing protein n=1 Tax=Actinokineospora sp. NBRC 105648 TaxID=3032206 RepID=UPI0024A4CD1A|nr:glycosyl hydrolase family 18 protein [Actinokineospora sp. NBRC 105648]GLZ43043.1 chitinase [Actinokineospora sp. NBRC 105648]
MVRKSLPLLLLLALLSGITVAVSIPATSSAAGQEDCRPDGLATTPNVAVPYCLAYDTAGREKMGADHPRRVIGYFTSWRTGKNGQPSYLAKDIPWDKVTHVNYAFGHIDGQGKLSVGDDTADNPSTGIEWPGVPGAETDPAYPYKGHFNQLNKFKKQHPNVKTLISVGGWAETGGYIGADGKRVADGGFYALTDSAAKISAFADSAVSFVRKYGFNGVDIDYEYATSMNNSGNPDDFSISNPRRARLMAGYVTLMKTLREKLDAASAADNKYYLLSVAAPSSGYMLRGMENYQVTQYLDYVNMMTYDLHGAWNNFVGPNAALYDDGKDAELQFWQYYSTAQYGGLGYLNSDWAYHYFRGAMGAGRINLGIPYYTRGWQGVTGGTNGLWGSAPLPDQTKCPPGTGGTVGSKVNCGNGAVGADNLWHDLDVGGGEVPAGSNPLWHAKNLQDGKIGSYATAYGLDPVNKPQDRVTGTYARNYDSTLVAPWLWNATKKVFLSTEDEQSAAVKAQYVADKGLGGVMIWELAGDYAYDQTKGEYFMGSTLTNLFYDKFKAAAPYGNTKAKIAMPADSLDVKVSLGGFPVGDANYPITPKAKITNSSTQTLPGGTEIQFDYGTSAPPTIGQQSGWALSVVSTGHTGTNIGGLKGDLHRFSIKLPGYQTLAPGASADVQLSYYLPVAQLSNITITFGGKSYTATQEYLRGSGGTTPTSTTVPTSSSTTTTVPTSTTTTPTSSTTTTTTTTTTPTTTTRPPTCTAAAWDAAKVYATVQTVSYNGRQYKNKWWTQGDRPDLSGQWGVWQDLGPC